MLDTLELDKYIKNLSDLPMLFNHFGRYFYAMKKLNINKNDVVVDASCGQGYGAYNIMLKSSMTFGLDVNEKYIKYANDHFKFERLYFLTYGEFYKLGQRAHKVICLETIEHMEKNKIAEFLENLIKILISNGEIILSFPIGNNTQSIPVLSIRPGIRIFRVWVRTIIFCISQQFPIISFLEFHNINTAIVSQYHNHISCYGH